MTKVKKSSYYSLHDVLTRNGVYNFITGPRGNGKTYSAKKHAIKRFIDRGEQFIYLRRYSTELSSTLTFFADVGQEFDGWDFQVFGGEFKIRREGSKDKWVTMGYAFALSKSATYKSKPMPNVHTIIFDEYLIEKGHRRYLQNEATVFNDFFNTVDRYQDRVRVFFLGNSISIANPYFNHFKITPPISGEKEWVTSGNGFIVAHFPKSNSYVNEVGLSRFAQFIQNFDPDYAEYAMASLFKDNTGDLLGRKHKDARYLYSLSSSQGSLSVWIYKDLFFLQEKQPESPNMFTTDHNRVTRDVHLLESNNYFFTMVKNAYGKGGVLFDKPSTRATFVSCFNF